MLGLEELDSDARKTVIAIYLWGMVVFTSMLTMVVGWFMNIVMLLSDRPEETTHLILSIVGVVFAPVGAVVGWLWIFV